MHRGLDRTNMEELVANFSEVDLSGSGQNGWIGSKVSILVEIDLEGQLDVVSQVEE